MHGNFFTEGVINFGPTGGVINFGPTGGVGGGQSEKFCGAKRREIFSRYNEATEILPIK